MKRILMLIPVLTLFLTGSFLATKDNVEKLSPAQFKSKIDENKYTLIDVRTAKEFNSGHIQGAVNVDCYSSDFQKEIMKYKNEDAVLIYCQVGGRSSSVARKLATNGFKKIYELGGGLNAFVNEGYKITE